MTGKGAALFWLAALPRLAYLLIIGPGFIGPYWPLSDELLRSGSLGFAGVRSTDFEPIYPVFLAAARIVSRDHVLGVQLLQIVVSSAGCVLLYRCASVLTGSSRVAVMSAVLYAGDLLLIKQSVGQSPLVLVTTVVIAFAYAFVTAATTTRAIGAGVILGLLVLTRMMTVPLVVCMAIVLVVESRPRAAMAAALAALVFILPWSARSYTVNGSWWPTRNGLNLFLSSLPVAATLVPDYDVDVLEPLAAVEVGNDMRRPGDDSPASTEEIDRILTRRAIANFSVDPVRTLKSRAGNLVHYFWPPIVPYYVEGPDTRVVDDGHGGIAVVNAVERSRVEVVGYSILYTVVLAAAVAGAVERRRALLSRDSILMCILGTFALIHAVYFPATRYRAPVTFILLFYAAVALDRASTAARARWWRPISASTPIPA